MRAAVCFRETERPGSDTARSGEGEDMSVKPEAVKRVEAACLALAAGSLKDAIEELDELDLDGLRREIQLRRAAIPKGLPGSELGRPTPVPVPVVRALFAEHQWTCRYSPCGYSMTVDVRVLKQVQRVTGTWLHLRAGDLGWHPITDLHQTVHDHVLGGGEVLTTACWGCNGPKNNIPFEELRAAAGWAWDRDPPGHRWTGLTEFLNMLKRWPDGAVREPAD
jgi:hypothetical protein